MQDPSPLCRIEMFGPLCVARGDLRITRFVSQKTACLLGYLALHRNRSHTRERLVDLLWPDLTPEAGRDNLSTSLSSLRRQIETADVPKGAIFQADRLTVGLGRERVATDVAEFDLCLQQAEQEPDAGARARLFGQAVALYRGDLMDGHYDEWIVRAQSEYRERFTATLARWSTALEEAGDLEAALSAVRRVIEADHFQEAAYLNQMRLLVRLGRKPAAQETSARLRQWLLEEMDTEPSPEFEAAAERILQESPTALPGRRISSLSELAEGRSTSVSPPARGPEPALPPALLRSRPPQPVLPFHLTRFFGREEEAAQLRKLLLPPSDFLDGERLVTVIGPGGTGKTRLAIELGRQLADEFGGRVWFLPLADLRHGSEIPRALLHVLQRSQVAGVEPLDQALQILGDGESAGRSLLILDNLEQLLGEERLPDGGTPAETTVGIVQRLLEGAPLLSCLVTSRTCLRLGGEREFPLGPLMLPGESASPETLLACGSVALYVDRALAAKPDFAVTASNAEAVSALCRRLEGMPLAIEMAAAWAKSLPPARMLERLDRQLDLLVSRRRDLPPRHQSLRATIEWSYELVAPDLQRLFAALAVFQGGWALEAAEAVCGAEALFGLEALRSHSLVVLEENEEQTRYRLLEPLREFAAERLETFGERLTCRLAHLAYFLRFAEDRAQAFWGPRQSAIFADLEREQENLRTALDTALEADPEAGLRLATALFRYWQRHALREGSSRFAALLQHPRAQEPTLVRAGALNGAGILAFMQADYSHARTLHTESLAIARAQGDLRTEANALHGLANSYHYEHRHEEARPLFLECLELRKLLNDKTGMASLLHSLGNHEMLEERYETARAYMAQSLALRREIGDQVACASTLGALGQLARKEGNLEAAEEAAREALPIFHASGVLSNVALCLGDLANIAYSREQWERAVVLLGAVDSVRATSGFPHPPHGRASREEQERELREALGDSVFDRAWQSGAAMNAAEAVSFALEAVDDAGS